jgi:hypothetical protein
MKKIFVMMLICFSGVSVFAAENSNFPSSVEPGNIITNVGMGLLNSPALSNHGIPLVPPLSISAEYALPISIPLSVGAVIGFTSSEQSGGDETWTVFSIGAKAAYHFKWEIRGLDTYATLTLGGNFLSGNDPGFLFGLEVGVRFFFNSNVGVFIEEGFNTFTYLRSGLVFKF